MTLSRSTCLPHALCTVAVLGHLEIDQNEMVAQLEQYSNGESGEISYVEFIGMIVDDNDYVQQHIKTHLVAFREAFNLFDTSGRGNRSLASPCALLLLLYLSSPPVWLHMLLSETLSPSL